MSVTTDKNGNLKARFSLPAHLAAGCHRIQCVGSKGHYAETGYPAHTTITESSRRVIGQAIKPSLPDKSPADKLIPRFDPVVQTFTLPQGQHIGGMELYFIKSSHYPVQVQLRETHDNKIDTPILAQGEVLPAAIQDGHHNRPTRITWPPVWLEAGRTYAIAIHTEDRHLQVAVAVQGKGDHIHHRRVMPQDVSQGIFYRGTRPLAGYALNYRLLAARFTQRQAVIPLGDVTLKNATDLIVLANTLCTGTDTQVHFRLRDNSGHEIRLHPDQPLPLSSALTGRFCCEAILQGTATQSPVVYRGIQLVSATLSESADYITRTLPAASNSTVTITLEVYDGCHTGAGSRNDNNRNNNNNKNNAHDTHRNAMVTALVETADNHFEAATRIHSKPAGDGWVEHVHQLTPLNREQTRVKLVLQGDAASRIRVRNLRVVVT
nr:hypothetical protein 9 [Coxiellaceae bacterium]